MTQKEIHSLNFWWTRLVECCAEKGRAVSAGELAKCAGTSRNTADKWLKELIRSKVAERQRVRYNTRFKKAVYTAVTGADEPELDRKEGELPEYDRYPGGPDWNLPEQAR